MEHNFSPMFEAVWLQNVKVEPQDLSDSEEEERGPIPVFPEVHLDIPEHEDSLENEDQIDEKTLEVFEDVWAKCKEREETDMEVEENISKKESYELHTSVREMGSEVTTKAEPVWAEEGETVSHADDKDETNHSDKSREEVKSETEVEENSLPQDSTKLNPSCMSADRGKECRTNIVTNTELSEMHESGEQVSLSGKNEFMCNNSSEDFLYVGDYSNRSLAHTSERPFKCEICSKSFNRLDYLSKHKSTHTGDKPFKCNVCGKSFTQSGNLGQHMRTHTGDKPCKCEVCGKCFAQSGGLGRHMRTHTGDKPFKCEICSKCFAQSGNLTKHMSTHTGHKPFKCTECGVCFTRAGSLTLHLRTHTGDKPYNCEVCSKCFSRSDKLANHMKTHTRVRAIKK